MTSPFNFTPESYRIKTIEKIELKPRAYREKRIGEVGYNVFMLDIDDIFIDLLTDSGTSAMSDEQWAAMLTTKQAYAGSNSYRLLDRAVKEIFGFEHFVPTHQGRAAEHILFSTIITKEGQYVPNNTHFDTTEANVMYKKGIPMNLPVEEAYQPGKVSDFKGNMDTNKLENFINEKGPENIPVVMLTITNNTVGGQPVSMKNIRKVSEIAHDHKIPMFLDACRFAENAFFIKEREPGYRDKTIREIVKEEFSYADGCTFSGKKEALTNIGGMLCTRDKELYEKFRNLLVVIEGFPTYGGMACRELAAMAVGLHESTDYDYQKARHAQIEFLADSLDKQGVPIVKPAGGHAVYVDGKEFLPHLTPDKFPAQSLTAQLYIESGIRAVELGNSCFGKTGDDGNFIPAKLDLMRLAIPRRRYTISHLAYVADSVVELYEQRDQITGLKRVYAPKLLGHFLSRFEPIPKNI
ncbi:MAG: tryptophanase [Candidatus Diapherotrites archaeon]|nr:tryptophanase [Candidatus Diapherotrites archaeon]